ncbi:MAG: acetoacetate decarboxylase family protein [Burkholderiaceae bacterium]|jgi:hypothetical protein|nr:acetoacetate decarboxylase family protein [Burkholderiaceae bacterium]
MDLTLRSFFSFFGRQASQQNRKERQNMLVTNGIASAQKQIEPGHQTRHPSAFLKGIVQTEYPLPKFDRMGFLPVFYYDNTSMTAAFTAATKKVRALLPDPDMRLVEFRPGRCVAVISCFEYRDSDIDPYNEVSMAFLISHGRRSLPAVKLLKGLYDSCFEAYVWKLPVTTEIARWGGVELYGFPKFVADIHFTRTAGTMACRLACDNQHILTLEGKVLKTSPRKKPLRYRAYSVKDGLPLCANVYTSAREFAQSMLPNSARLTLGEHEIGRTLRNLDLAKMPLMYQYSPINEVSLFGPRNLMDD